MFCKCDYSFQMQFTQIAFRFYSSLLLLPLLSYRSSLNVIFVVHFRRTFHFRFRNTPLYTIALKLNVTIVLKWIIKKRKDFLSLLWHAVNGVNALLKRFSVFPFLLPTICVFCYRVTMCTVHTALQ